MTFVSTTVTATAISTAAASSPSIATTAAGADHRTIGHLWRFVSCHSCRSEAVCQ